MLVAVGVGIQVFAGNGQVGTDVAGPRWLTVPLIAVLSVPLLWRRTKPLLVGSIVLGGIVVQGLVTGSTPEGIPFIVIWVVVPYGMAAYADLQEAEVGSEPLGYEATRHQELVGTGYFDEVMRTVAGNGTSTTAMDGSTERAQFNGSLHRPSEAVPPPLSQG